MTEQETDKLIALLQDVRKRLGEINAEGGGSHQKKTYLCGKLDGYIEGLENGGTL